MCIICYTKNEDDGKKYVLKVHLKYNILYIFNIVVKKEKFTYNSFYSCEYL